MIEFHSSCIQLNLVVVKKKHTKATKSPAKTLSFSNTKDVSTT